MERHLNPQSNVWDGPEADYLPTSDDIPFWRVPEHKVTVEDIKYVLSDHYQGTPYDPYGHHGPDDMRGAYRPIGINRNNILLLTQIRADMPEGIRDVQWIAMGSNVFNAMIPFYANVTTTPAYVRDTGAEVSTDNFYWANRLIAAMADSHFAVCASPLERYQHAVHGKGQAMLRTLSGEHGHEKRVCALRCVSRSTEEQIRKRAGSQEAGSHGLPVSLCADRSTTEVHLPD